MNALTLTLPYPPSSNHLWRHVNGRTLISAKARAYRKAVADTVFLARVSGGPLSAAVTGLTLPLGGRLALTLTLIAATRNRCDLDNHIKVAQDALTYAGVWRDDAQIDELRIVRGAVDKQQPRLEAIIAVVAPE